ncbi:MAG: hypothetical protein J6A44_03275 [Paludibacteraceae bacterium]|nr:hypothetical protein [Paludibacteraceae bacterium]
MIQYPDTLQASTQGFAIARAKELGGHRQVATLDELYGLPDAWLSESKTNANNDAIGQQWYVVAQGTTYRLINWDNRKSTAGWEEETTVSTAEIDSLFE